jgi:hypothetical protein
MSWHEKNVDQAFPKSNGKEHPPFLELPFFFAHYDPKGFARKSES